MEILWNTDFGDLYSDECAMSPLDKRAVMKVMYTDTMRGYIEKGYVRKCPINCDRTSPVNYLPHHPVMHPKKKKLHIIFDCAARFQGQCINNLLIQGPDGTNSLLGVLLRFHAHHIAVAADIKEMFH